MKNSLSTIVAAATVSVAIMGSANAAEILISNNIATSVTWTRNNTYNLQKQVYVLPGATLTIEPGTIIASTTNIGGSIAVCRGAKIIARGTQQDPIIFTSKADVATWTSGNPKTGTWRTAANEWGNLTIMGRAYISDSQVAGNTKSPSATNLAVMEGLVAEFAGDPNVLYGGNNDSDDSGTLSYCSFRYGGKVVGLNNELNGLSIGGVGKQTTIDHMEIMNNVDDGIEIWGGTVNLQYISVWNIGDDSLDIDQGWRGKVQFGLIVQGYSVGAAQGSGVGDNAIEIDGAEDSDAQPVTTGVLYNMTVIGQPISGDHGTAWRDNANMQVRNSIFMDLGERLVQLDNVDGDGGSGYGFNGTTTWANRWTTPFSTTSTVNPFASPATAYQAQVSGNLCQISDSVFFRNNFASAYTEATARGVFGAPLNNVNAGTGGASGVVDQPIVAIVRAAPITPFGTLTQLRVLSIDPRAANAAATSIASAPVDNFYEQAAYRGAFSPTKNWMCDWTAADAFGMNTAPAGSCVVTTACPADLNGSGNIDAADLAILLSAWAGTAADINADGTTDAADLAILLSGWGNCA